MSDDRQGGYVVIVGSAPIVAGMLASLATSATSLICADGGADAALAAGLRPDLVIGDLDSIAPATLELLRTHAVRFEEHPPAKDQTDLELALTHALRLHPARITIAGGLGGARFDHSLGNVLLLTLPELRDVDVRLVDSETELRATWGSLVIQGAPGQYVSLLPLSPRVGGIRTSGLLYPLHDETLIQGHTRGVSNELIGPEATVAVREGCLLVTRQFG